MRCWRRNDDSTKTNPGCYVFPYQEDAADHRTGPEPPRAAHPVSWAAASSPPVAPFPSACSPFPLGVARAFASGCSSDLEPLPPPGLSRFHRFCGSRIRAPAGGRRPRGGWEMERPLQLKRAPPRKGRLRWGSRLQGDGTSGRATSEYGSFFFYICAYVHCFTR